MPDSPARPEVSISGGEAGSFLLEIVGLTGIAMLGWNVGDGRAIGLSLSALFVALAGGIWATFRTRGFVPNGGDPIVAIPGPVRLVLELSFYGLAIAGFWMSGWRLAAAILALGVIIVSFVLRDRTLGLVRAR